MNVTLYTTLGCHLCEEALQLLQQVQQAGTELQVSEVEIADSDELIERYGIRIPVVADESGGELGWPFDLAGLQTFLEATGT